MADNDDDDLFALAHQAAEELNLHHDITAASSASQLGTADHDALLQEALREVEAVDVNTPTRREQSIFNNDIEFDDIQLSGADKLDSNGATVGDQNLAPSEALRTFQQMWLNEYLCPELMPHNVDVYETMQVYLDVLGENIQTLRSQPDKQRHATKIHTSRMEVARVRYILSSYTQMRIRKLEQHAYYLTKLSDEDRRSLLSQEEIDYLFSYKRMNDVLIESHFRLEVSEQFPICREFLTKVKLPFDNQYVVIRMVRDCPGVVVDPSIGARQAGISNLERGQQYLIRYGAVRHLILNGSAILTLQGSQKVTNKARLTNFTG